MKQVALALIALAGLIVSAVWYLAVLTFVIVFLALTWSVIGINAAARGMRHLARRT